MAPLTGGFNPYSGAQISWFSKVWFLLAMGPPIGSKNSLKRKFDEVRAHHRSRPNPGTDKVPLAKVPRGLEEHGVESW